jgi:UDP-N-acetylmuramyl tripeptide synthase
VVETVARLTGSLSRLAGAGAGTSLPGVILEKLDPDFVARRAAELPDGVMVVSGTNGKTTTASMIRAILAEHGSDVIGNTTGANLVRGVATALLESPPSARVAVFEVDEGALPGLVPMVAPRVLVLTNVFRDQLDRFGEPERVATLLGRSATLLPAGATVVANADDPHLWGAVAPVHPVGYGVVAQDGASPPADLPSPVAPSRATTEGEPEACPNCGAELTFLRRTIANLGTARCDRCGWTSAEPEFEARILRLGGLDSVEFEIKGEPITLPMGGIHNVYNAAAAIAATAAVGVPITTAVNALDRFAPRFGRSEALELDGRPVWLALIKNPAGAGAVIREVVTDPRVGAAVIAISDQTADGRDISWIWDADFERLVEFGIPLVPSGRRAFDTAVRLKYAGVDPEPVQTEPPAAIRAAQARCREGAPLVVVLATYTAMLDVRRAFARSRAGRVLDSPRRAVSAGGDGRAEG